MNLSNTEHITIYFLRKLDGQSVDVIARFADHPELTQLLQDAHRSIAEDVRKGTLDRLEETLMSLVKTGADCPDAFSVKDCVSLLAAKNLFHIVQRCPSCNPPEVLHALREIAANEYSKILVILRSIDSSEVFDGEVPHGN